MVRRADLRGLRIVLDEPKSTTRDHEQEDEDEGQIGDTEQTVNAPEAGARRGGRLFVMMMRGLLHDHGDRARPGVMVMAPVVMVGAGGVRRVRHRLSFHSSDSGS